MILSMSLMAVAECWLSNPQGREREEAKGTGFLQINAPPRSSFTASRKSEVQVQGFYSVFLFGLTVLESSPAELLRPLILF